MVRASPLRAGFAEQTAGHYLIDMAQQVSWILIDPEGAGPLQLLLAVTT